MIRLVRYCRWALLVTLLLALVSEIPAWWSRDVYRRLPDYDFVAEGNALMRQNRLSDARTVAEAGMASARRDQAQRSRQLLQRIDQRTGSLRYRAAQLARGVFLGSGDNAWSLGGAVVSDLFVFGDVRDLAIQGTRAMSGRSVDKVMVGLSTLGLATTLLPVTDLGLDLLKGARRTGALTGKFLRALGLTARDTNAARDAKALYAVARDAGRVERRAGPAAARAVLGAVDSPTELARAARFVERNPQGGFALWLSGRRGIQALNSQEGGDLLLAVRKGRAGLAWLGRGSTRLLHFHPVLGLFKGFYKSNLINWAVAVAGKHVPLLLLLSVFWLMLESISPVRRLRSRRRSGNAVRFSPGTG